MLQLAMLSYKDIIEKIKDILSKELGMRKVFDKDVANALGIEYNRFRQQKYRDIYIPYYAIMEFLVKRKISINFFFFNQLPETLIEETNKYVILKYTTNASAGGKVFSHLDDSQNIIIDKKMLAYLKASDKHTQVVNVAGDSMHPLLEDKSLIFVDTSKTALNEKDIFLIEAKNNFFVKKIYKKKNTHYLKSINPNYKDIPIKNFKIIGKVVGVLNKI